MKTTRIGEHHYSGYRILKTLRKSGQSWSVLSCDKIMGEAYTLAMAKDMVNSLNELNRMRDRRSLRKTLCG